jgi:predicted nucleic acid-binding protein
MLVVSNTSPILNLAIIGQLGLLRNQFEQIHIPQAVLDELCISEDLPGVKAVRQAIKDDWIKIVQAREQNLAQAIGRDLDRGEAESIALALQLKADLILLDERDGRQVAKAIDLNVTGVFGVLLKARRAGRLVSLRQAIDDLREQAGFRIHPSLLAELQSLPEYQDSWKPRQRVAETRQQYGEPAKNWAHRRRARKVDLNLDANPPTSQTRRQGPRKL